MKLILRGGRVADIVDGEYNGLDHAVDAPADFSPSKIPNYQFIDGALIEVFPEPPVVETPTEPVVEAPAETPTDGAV